jgi:hypothetical protein
MKKFFLRANIFVIFSAVLTIFIFNNIHPVLAQNDSGAGDIRKIAELEDRLRKEPENFSFETHNELRHLYNGRDERKMFYHCDTIFRNSVMNPYILSILSGWKLDKDPGAAVSALENARGKYPVFYFVTLACLIKEGELHLKLGDEGAARKKFALAAASSAEGTQKYKTIAAAAELNIGRKAAPGPWTIPVLEIRYFPLTPDGKNIDIAVTSNVGAPLDEIRRKCERLTKEVASALEEGSRFRAYKDAGAKPSLKYKVIDTIEFLEPLPHHAFKKFPDYKKILERIDIKEFVEKKGVKEVWIWGYHSKELAPWESNMASPRGDISNSDRDPDDLPILTSTYTVFHYNYERSASEATENHMHQIESLLAHFNRELFELFTGKPGKWRCGNCHYPPNGRTDYDWTNKEYASTDIEDWRPEGIGEEISINCDRWNGDSLKWFIYWMQSLPGEGNALRYGGKTLTNWWVVVGDYDGAVNEKNAMMK